MVATTWATTAMCSVEWEIVQKGSTVKNKKSFGKNGHGYEWSKPVRARISVAQCLHAEM